MTRNIASTQGRGIAAALAVGLLLSAAPAHAQRGWGRPRPPRAGACFYQNANFGGDYFCVEQGDEYDVMPDGLNDRISSIRIFGDASVVVYRNPSFGGRQTRFTDDAERIVRRAYQTVLGRDPDDGARGWVDRVMRDRWTQSDVERELRKSPEYRNRPPPQQR